MSMNVLMAVQCDQNLMMQLMKKINLSNYKSSTMRYFHGTSCYAAVVLATALFPVQISSSFVTNTNTAASRCTRRSFAVKSLRKQNVPLSGIDPRSNNLVLSSFTSSAGDGTDVFASPPPPRFRRGNPIQVEVTRFGPLGATVEVIAKSHNENDLIPPDEPPLAYGLVLQQEIGYFRAARGGLDVVVGEILPAYVNWVRDDGKVDITLRKPGGKGKAEDLSKTILEKIQNSPAGEIQVGDKSSPQDINRVFPGASKAQFKRAVALLYKKGLVKPGATSTTLM